MEELFGKEREVFYAAEESGILGRAFSIAGQFVVVQCPHQADGQAGALAARDLLHRPAAFDRTRLGALGIAARVGPLVATLDQEPLWL